MPRRVRKPRPPAAPRDAGAERAAHAVGFFGEMLQQTMGEWAGQPFALLPWQRTLTAQIFGTLRADGLRRYRRVYVEIPRKNGKTTYMAGLGLYLLLADGEPGAEIVSAAVDRDQAALAFEVARRMVELNPDLAARVAIYRRELVVRGTGAKYKVLSADADKHHGLNPHGILFDELHMQRDNELWIALTQGTGARRQPLTIAITTAGYDRTSICWQEHEYAEQVRAGVIADPSFLSVIYAAAPEDDWRAPATWAKANPSLGATIKREYFETECLRAQHQPMLENDFKRYHLNLWTEQYTRWLAMEAWLACGAVVADDVLVGVPAYGGLDMGESSDFSAFVLVFLLDGGRVAVRAWYWIPETARVANPHRPYAVWERQGYLTVIAGNTTDPDIVEQDVLAQCERWGVREVAYDKRFATGLALHLQAKGVTMVDQRQGYELNEPLQRLEQLVLDRKLAHGGDPVLAWMAANMVVETGQRGEIRAAKHRAGDKIDGVVALAMALGRALRHNPEGEESHYADGHSLVLV